MIKSFKQFMRESRIQGEQVEVLDERSMMGDSPADIKHKKKLALDFMHNLIKKRGARHSLGYYAAEVMRVFDIGVKPRELEQMYVDQYGAVEGKKLEEVREWLEDLLEEVEIPNEDKHKDIPRDEMPQIALDDVDMFSQYLQRNGVKTTLCDMSAKELYPTQNEFDEDKVAKLVDDYTSWVNTPILISSNLYIIDGHHRWLACSEMKVPVLCRRFEIRHKQLLQMAREYAKTKNS